MLTITKQCTFDAAHILTNHAGQCKNLHGHTYRLIVEVGEKEIDHDMVMDFKDLKNLLHEVILSRFDHAFIYDETSPIESEIASVIEKHGMKRMPLPFRSTAENMVRFIFTELSKQINVTSVKLYDTPDSCAECKTVLPPH